MLKIQRDFLRALDEGGVRPFIEALMQGIHAVSHETAREVDNPDNGYHPPLQALAFGVMQYAKHQSLMLRLTLENGFIPIPNRYRSTAQSKDFIFQLRRFR